LVRNEGVVEEGGDVVEALEYLAFHIGFYFCEHFRVERFLELQQGPQKARMS
jgi:hypothetical protein